MLELFNVSWTDLTQKMPEIAEAGYTSLWLPQPGQGRQRHYSVGYDLFDPFDLGDKNQNGTIATRWGTKAELLQMVETAHRFGIRVYFDNVMNHRAVRRARLQRLTRPPIIYPGLCPQDFHLQTVPRRALRELAQTCELLGQPVARCRTSRLAGLFDLANEPGSINYNFGPTLGSTDHQALLRPPARQPGLLHGHQRPAGALGGSSWHPFNGSQRPAGGRKT